MWGRFDFFNRLVVVGRSLLDGAQGLGVERALEQELLKFSCLSVALRLWGCMFSICSV